MMSPTDHGLTVICGDWPDINRYIIDHGLDPIRVIRPGNDPLGLHFTVNQVILLDGWVPDYDEVEWFWYQIAGRMHNSDMHTALIERARAIPGLSP